MIKTLQLTACLAKLSINTIECRISPKRLFSLTSELSRKNESRTRPPNLFPSSNNKRWVEIKPMRELYEYTTDPLPFPSTGGRGPNGKIWNHKRGGGLKKVFYMIDDNRANPELMKGKDTLIEKVYEIKSDQNRSGHIALVVGNEHKRYIMATENMKVGDLIASTTELTKNPIRPTLGNSYPLGSLPIGTLVCCVERTPGGGAALATSAGVAIPLVKRYKDEDGEDVCVVRMSSKREMIVSSNCQATVGRISNTEHNKEHWGKAGAKRLAGIRPRSGVWRRKSGQHGRKIRPIRPPVNVKLLKSKPAEATFHIKGKIGLMQKWWF